MASLAITAIGKTDIGQVRSTNQDSLLVDEVQGLFIVADGMGGHAGGEIASSLAIREIKEYLSNVPISDAMDEATIGDILTAAVNHASGKIYERALEDPALKGMGTTLTLAKTLTTGTAHCAHVGDSRLYLWRSGIIYQISYDHSLVNEQVRAGILTKEEAEIHHLKNVITRSVGYQEEEDIDTLSFAVEAGDRLLLCSDGLHGKVSDIELAKLIADGGKNSVGAMIDLANQRGGDDNVTALVIEINALGK